MKWDKHRHASIVDELAELVGFSGKKKLKKKLKKFYAAAYATAVYDIADDGVNLGREELIKSFAPPRLKLKS